jgi:hypothetical protein
MLGPRVRLTQATLEDMRRRRDAIGGQPLAAAPTAVPPSTPVPTSPDNAATPSPAAARAGWQPNFTPQAQPTDSVESRVARRRRALSALDGVLTKAQIIMLIDMIEETDEFMTVMNDAYEEAGLTLSGDTLCMPSFSEEFDERCFDHAILEFEDDLGLSFLQLCEAERKRLASKKEPTTMKQIHNLEGNERKLVRDAMLDEVLWLLDKKKVIPKNKRDVSQLYELDGKWVIKYKKDLRGLLERVRARWVLRGDKQRPGIDFDPNTLYSPVASKSSTLTTLAIGVQHGLEAYTMDSAKAFTVSPPDVKDLHIKVPHLMEEDQHRVDIRPHGDNTTFELLTSLYGLRQASAIYYRTVARVLLAYTDPQGRKYRRCPEDPCTFVKGSLPTGLDPATGVPNKGDYIVFTMHVDDQFCMASSKAQALELHGVLEKGGFDVTLEIMTKVLGVGITYIPYDGTPGTGKLVFDHSGYIVSCYEAVKANFPPSEQTPRGVPLMDHDMRKRPTEETVYDQARYKLFRKILGQCAHCSHFSHPEIETAINIISQHMSNPSDFDLQCIWNVLRYLYGTTTKLNDMAKFTFHINLDAFKAGYQQNPLHLLCDANLEVTYSRSGYCAYLWGMLVGWASKKQNMVALSTCESEYVALTTCGQFAKWYMNLAASMGVDKVTHDPITILTDSNAAKLLAESPVDIINAKSRHIERRVHWIRDEIRANRIRLYHVDGVKNTSDIFTKLQKKVLFLQCRDKLLHGDRRIIRDIVNVLCSIQYLSVSYGNLGPFQHHCECHHVATFYVRSTKQRELGHQAAAERTAAQAAAPAAIQAMGHGPGSWIRKIKKTKAMLANSHSKQQDRAKYRSTKCKVGCGCINCEL